MKALYFKAEINKEKRICKIEYSEWYYDYCEVTLIEKGVFDTEVFNFNIIQFLLKCSECNLLISCDNNESYKAIADSLKQPEFNIKISVNKKTKHIAMPNESKSIMEIISENLK